MKQQSNDNENYSRRKNIVIRGITENDNETNVMCEEEARTFMCEKLNISMETVTAMDIVRSHRMGDLDGKRRGRHEQKRPLIVRFNNFKDKSVVWEKRFELAGSDYSLRENYSRATEFNRQKSMLSSKRPKILIIKDALSAGLSAICVNHECSNVDIVVSQYNEDLSKLLDKHAPQKKIQIVDRPLNDWMNDDIQALKAIRRKKEDIWRKNPIVVNFEIYQDSCTAVKNAIAESKTHVMQEKIAKTKDDQKELFKIVKTLLCLKKQTVLPEYCDPTILASRFNHFFVDKIEHIGMDALLVQWILFYQHVLLLLEILPWLLLRS